jgi:uncharacterized protein YuzE
MKKHSTILGLLILTTLLVTPLTSASFFDWIDTNYVNATDNITIGTGDIVLTIDGNGTITTEGSFIQNQLTSTNYLGFTYMKGLKSRLTDGSGGLSSEYMTFYGSDNIGKINLETTNSSSPYYGNLVQMRFDLSDESIHLDNPIIIDTDDDGAIPHITIVDGSDTVEFAPDFIKSSSATKEVIITPESIVGSPTIIMDKAEQDTDVLRIINTDLVELEGTAHWEMGNPEILTGISDSTNWLTDLQVGDLISFFGEETRITTITSDTYLTHNGLSFFDTEKNGVLSTVETNRLIIDSDGYFNSHILPDGQDTRNLGSPDHKWASIYTSWINNVTIVDYEDAVDHSQDNSQAHSDYLINNGNDVTSGTLGASGFTLDGTTITSWDDVNQSSSGNSLWTNNSGILHYSKGINVSNITNNGVFYQPYYPWNIGNEVNIYEKSNSVIVTDYCDHEGGAMEFLCSSPYFLLPNKGIINVMGRANSVMMKLGASIIYENNITGHANNLFGKNIYGFTTISGDGNLVGGSGDFNVSGSGNLVTGARNVVSGDNGITAGGLLISTAESCTNLGAQNSCLANYATVLGYGNTVSGGTAMGVGKDNLISGYFSGGFGTGNIVSDQKTYVFGNYVNETNSDTITFGNGAYGNLNRDIRISQDNITINKIMIHNNIISTGSNAGTSICLDANNQLCPCGSCA